MIVGKVQIFLLSLSIVIIAGTPPNSKNCTQAEKLYYGTYKFSVCDEGQYDHWCFRGDKMDKYKAKFFKEFDPDNYRDGMNCSEYSTSCDYIRFLIRVCGSHYKVCHTQQERKPIIKMWIKQFIRRAVYRVGEFEDDVLELKNGKCNDILQEFFDDEEITEISAMIGPADIKQVGVTGYNFFGNLTIRPMGALSNKDGTERMPITESLKNVASKIGEHDLTHLTIPSHWKYCEFKLTQPFDSRTPQFHNLGSVLPDLWHCDGKCNTNKGDDQAWYETMSGVGGMYRDLSNGEFKKEDYMKDLIRDRSAENSTEKGIDGCHDDTLHDYKNDECQRYQNFVNSCLDPIDRCLGNIAIREVVLFAAVRDYEPYKCWEKTSNSNYLLSSLILTVICFQFHRAL